MTGNGMQLTLELFLGIWGSVLATIAIGWNLIRAYRKRTRVTVSCSIRHIVEPGVGVTATNQLYWHMVNAGAKDVFITHVCGKMKEKPKEFLVPDFTPQRLKSGDYSQHIASEYPNPNDIACLYVSDSLGRKWKAPRRNLKEIRRVLATDDADEEEQS